MFIGLYSKGSIVFDYSLWSYKLQTVPTCFFARRRGLLLISSVDRIVDQMHF